MAAVTNCSTFGAPQNKVCHFPLFPHLFAMKRWDRMPWSYFSECWALSQLFPLTSFTFIKRLFSSSSLFAIRVVLFAYLRSLEFLPAILIPVSLKYTYIFSLLNLPCPLPSPLGILQSMGLTELSVWDSRFPLGTCFTYSDVYVSALLSQFAPPSSSPAVSTSLFSMFASLI